MEILVLGGTHFVGRAVVEDALRRGWRVTTLNRGRSPGVPGAEALTGDRTPMGRQETWEDPPDWVPQGPPYVWWDYHDAYDRTGTGAAA